MTFRILPLSTLTIALAACGGNPDQVLVTSVPSELRLNSIINSLEVRDVSLPRYAASDPVVVSAGGGVLTEIDDAVWADDPERALTLQLAGAIGTITGARVAAEPWPFAELPGATLTVRVEQALAGPSDAFRMSGQYAIAPVDAGISDRSGRFDISVPMPGDGAAAVAAAHSLAVTELAEAIARQIAR